MKKFFTQIKKEKEQDLDDKKKQSAKSPRDSKFAKVWKRALKKVKHLILIEEV